MYYKQQQQPNSVYEKVNLFYFKFMHAMQVMDQLVICNPNMGKTDARI